MSLMSALERVYIAMLHQLLHGETQEKKDLAYDLLNDLERMWPAEVAEIKQRYK